MSLAVFRALFGKPWLESPRILGTCFFNGLTSQIIKGRFVVTVHAIASLAVEFARETFAVELETTRLFAIAGYASRRFRVWRILLAISPTRRNRLGFRRRGRFAGTGRGCKARG